MEDIIDETHPTLRKKAALVSFPLTHEDKNILNALLQYIKNSITPTIAEEFGLRPSVGIAAPQIGVSKQMCAIYTRDEQNRWHEYQWINPQIISHSENYSYLKNGEGCLSVRRPIDDHIPRFSRITVRYDDPSGTKQSIRLRGFLAVVAQHEIDHLHGILFYDHIQSGIDLSQATPIALGD